MPCSLGILSAHQRQLSRSASVPSAIPAERETLKNPLFTGLSCISASKAACPAIRPSPVDDPVMKIRAILLCPMLGTNLPPLIVPQFKGVYLLSPVVKSGIAKLATASMASTACGWFTVGEHRLSPGAPAPQVRAASLSH